MTGPIEYVPPVEIEVLDTRKAIPLHQNEGIYVRNNKTGAVRAVIGQTYMLGEDEELWEKVMPSMIKALLDKNRDCSADRGEWVNPRKEDKRKRRIEDEDSESILDNERLSNFDSTNCVISTSNAN